MSDNQVFDQNKVQEWVALCEEGGNLRLNGASAETLAEINIRINKALVALLPSSNEANAELLFQMINGTLPQVSSAANATDPTDPN
jgi:gamma-glutamylcysteine synthetase